MPVSRRKSGGLHDFVDRGELEPLEGDRKEKIKKGYEEYRERKKRKRKIKIALIAIVVTAIVVGLVYFFVL